MSRPEQAVPDRPLISLIVSMYGVEQYLHAFLKSLDAQGGMLQEVELIFVDDGSPDRSAEIAADWLALRTVNGRLVRKPNGGLSSARNRGIAESNGIWVSFPDPDDVLGDRYLEILSEILRSADECVTAVAANILMLDDLTGAIADRHPLRKVFGSGTRLIALADEPQAVKLQAASTFFRRGVIVGMGLEFDHRIRPNFEDGAFMCRYQAGFEIPTLLVAAEARYFYRQRADGNSLVGSSWSKTEKYIDLPRYGWLETLRSIADETGRVPEWAQYIVLYDMHWYFRHDLRIHTPTRGVTAEVGREFLDLVRATLAYIAAEVILGYRITVFDLQSRVSLLALRGEQLPLSPVHIWRMDRFKPLLQLKYYFIAARPQEEFLAGRTAVEPVHAKDRAVVYFGQVVMHERILWLPALESLRVLLDGRIAQLAYGPPPMPALTVSREDLRKRFPSGARVQLSLALPAASSAAPTASVSNDALLPHIARLGALWRRRRAQLIRFFNGRSRLVRYPVARWTLWRSRHGTEAQAFHRAWVFMDRDTQAQDNSEHLYRWVSQNQPEVNAWFVLRKESSDWDRLEREGFRLVAFGTIRHRILLKNAEHLISSHIDHYVVHPWDIKLYGSEQWSYSFLQHGVTKDDISRWLTGKPIAMMVAAASSEYDAFVGDGTPYVLTAKETRLTGFPRHDALLAKAKRFAETRDTILIMPTWREYLMMSEAQEGNHRELVADFAESEYVRAWGAFLSNPELVAYAKRTGARLAFVPHPNLEAHVGNLYLPDDVEIWTYATSDVQESIARARVLVTDYSSLAFEAAYIGTPVVYFQFDHDEFFRRHPHRPGYFSYFDDGFGPVVTTVTDAATSTIEMLEGTSDAARSYAARAVAFFPPRDGANCERTYEAIRAIGDPSIDLRVLESRGASTSRVR